MADSPAKSPSFLSRPDKPDIAWVKRDGAEPGLMWLGGYASDMNGTKAQFIHGWAEEHGRAYLRFDYSGHGHSGGDFEDGGIGDWAQDALAVLDDIAEGPQTLIGSSMGAWIACLLAKWRPEKVASLVLLAPAADFTSALRWPAFTNAERETVLRDGRIEMPSAFDDSVTVYTKTLFDQGEEHSILTNQLNITAPVCILQGMRDEVVPWRHAVRLAEHLDSQNVLLTLIKNGDHRLSTPDDLEILADTLDRL